MTIQVVNKVRGQLSKLDRKTLSALIVIDVHARDVITELAALVSPTSATSTKERGCHSAAMDNHSRHSHHHGSVMFPAILNHSLALNGLPSF